MKLKDCISIAKACELTTLGEAYDNIDFHAITLFKYEEIDKEMQELRNEIGKKYNLKIINNNIDDILI